MSLTTVLQISALVVLLLWAFNQWIPIAANIKQGVSLVFTTILIVCVIVWAVRAVIP